MTIYLQMDGIDDKLTFTANAGVGFVNLTEFEIDIKISTREDWHQVINFGGRAINFNSNTVNLVYHADFQDVFVDNVKVTSGTPFLTVGQRHVIRGVLKSGITTGTSGTSIFNNGATQFLSGNIYSVKLLQSSVLKSFINTTTGTVQDQSGSGNHATLIGGTWVDDGVGGSGTPVTKSYSTKQTISATRSTLFSSKQTVFAPKQTLFASKQVISKPITTSYQTQQTITHVGGTEVSTLFQTKQRISLVRTSLFDTKQEIKGKFTKILNFYPSSQTEMKLEPKLGDTALEVVAYMGQTTYQPNDVRTVSEMEVTL